MQALILAAGLGTRLKPLSDIIPKCLVNIKGRQLLEIWLEKLDKLNVSKFVINTHHLHEKVNEFISKSKFNKKILSVYEEKLLGTAGTLIKNINEFNLNEDIIFLHADNYTPDDLTNLILHHNNRPSQCLITILAFRTNEPQNCGIMEVDKDGIMINFFEKPKNNIGNLANGAIYILSKDFFSFISSHQDAKNFSLDIMPKLKSKAYIYETKETFIDIGTHKNLKLANR